MLPVIFYTVVTGISAFVCYLISRKRKSNTAFWVGLAAVIGPLAIVLVLFSKPDRVL